MKNRLKGITLMETVVYLGLFSIIIILILNFMLTAQESSLRTERKGDLNRATEFVIAHIDDTFDHIERVDGVNSVFDSDDGVLDVDFESSSKQYVVSDGVLYYDGVRVTSDDVVVNQFKLSSISQRGTDISGVDVFILLSSVGDSSITESVNMLFTLR